MRRSEMLKTLETLLNNISVVTCSNKIKAQLILDEIESKGMTPPESAKYVQNLEFEGLVSSFEWEKEL